MIDGEVFYNRERERLCGRETEYESKIERVWEKEWTYVWESGSIRERERECERDRVRIVEGEGEYMR